MKISKIGFTNFLLFASMVFIYLTPSILNGFPFFLSDSGTYLMSGQIGEVPVDRPIIYGLFVRHISLSWSIWLVVIVQSVMINYSLWLIVKFIVKPKRVFIFYWILAFLLFLFTGISYHSNLIVADLFTSISIITFFVLLFIPKKNLGQLISCSILFGFSLIVHLSHVPVVLGLIVCCITVNFFKEKDQLSFRRIIIVFGVVLSSLLTLATVNYSFGAGFNLSRVKNLVFAARLVEAGMVNDYLKANCSKQGFDKSYSGLCQYVDNFKKWPNTGEFLWNSDSPIFDDNCKDRGGWTNCWIEKEEIYSELVADLLEYPKYQKQLMAIAITGTLKQLLTFEQIPHDKANFEWLIQKYYGDDLTSHKRSNQFNQRIDFEKSSLIEYLFFDISIILIIIFLVKFRKRIKAETKWFLLVIVLGLVGNAFICATLSNVVSRYQSRIVYLIPMILFIILFDLLRDKIKNKKLNLNKLIIT